MIVEKLNKLFGRQNEQGFMLLEMVMYIAIAGAVALGGVAALKWKLQRAEDDAIVANYIAMADAAEECYKDSNDSCKGSDGAWKNVNVNLPKRFRNPANPKWKDWNLVDGKTLHISMILTGNPGKFSQYVIDSLQNEFGTGTPTTDGGRPNQFLASRIYINLPAGGYVTPDDETTAGGGGGGGGGDTAVDKPRCPPKPGWNDRAGGTDYRGCTKWIPFRDTGIRG